MSIALSLIVAVLASLSCFVLVTVLIEMFNERARARGLRARLGMDPGEASIGGPSLLSALRRTMSTFTRLLGERAKPKDAESMDRTRLSLVRAGYRAQHAVAAFWGVKSGLGLGLGGLMLLARFLFFPHMLLGYSLLLAVIMAFLGVYLPDVWLKMRIRGRRKEFMSGLPDALDLLVVCVESGMGLDQALQRVGEEMASDNRIIHEELGMLIWEMRMGRARADAMQGLAQRVDLEDLTNLVTMIIQADAFGAKISQTLRVYADVLRTKRYQRAEECAARLPVKLLLPLIFCIFPALFIVIGGPAVLSLIDVFSSGI